MGDGTVSVAGRLSQILGQSFRRPDARLLRRSRFTMPHSGTCHNRQKSVVETGAAALLSAVVGLLMTNQPRMTL